MIARQFLIPWILLVKLPQIFCQSPQPPGFDHVDPFQHLFTHPTLAPPNSFGINGFSPLYGNHMIHPHYDLLASGGTNVMNPNFIHPHPFFPLHHQFPVTTTHFTTISSSPVPKSTQPSTQSSTTLSTTQSSTIQPSTQSSTQPSTKSSTIQPSTEQPTTQSTTRIPQAAKPALESVKTYSPESETKEQMPSLNTLEKMDTIDQPPKVPEVRKTQNFPTPSSTILPTAQHITNQTTTIQPIQSTMIQPVNIEATTNLPMKISAEAEKAALNGEKLDLIRHLNTTDLESFLQSANLSTHEAQTFLRTLIQVLEEELQKRLHKQAEKTELPIHSSEVPNPTISAAISTIKSDPKLLNSEGHEVKTVNTRLNYESAEIDQSTGVFQSSGVLPNSTISAHKYPKPSISSSQNPSRIVAYSQRSALEINSADKSHANPSFNSLDDVRKREQEEFDKLLGQIVLNNAESAEVPNAGEEQAERTEQVEAVDQNEDDDLLPAGFRNTNPPIQHPPRNNFNRLAIRHPPKTNFDKLAQDYQYRLSNSNGLNDLIKALRNAHIGFFDRTKKRQPKIRID